MCPTKQVLVFLSSVEILMGITKHQLSVRGKCSNILKNHSGLEPRGFSPLQSWQLKIGVAFGGPSGARSWGHWRGSPVLVTFLPPTVLRAANPDLGQKPREAFGEFPGK